jgi:hypothetical protein
MSHTSVKHVEYHGNTIIANMTTILSMPQPRHTPKGAGHDWPCTCSRTAVQASVDNNHRVAGKDMCGDFGVMETASAHKIAPRAIAT